MGVAEGGVRIVNRITYLPKFCNLFPEWMDGEGDRKDWEQANQLSFTYKQLLDIDAGGMGTYSAEDMEILSSSS